MQTLYGLRKLKKTLIKKRFDIERKWFYWFRKKLRQQADKISEEILEIDKKIIDLTKNESFEQAKKTHEAIMNIMRELK